MLYKVETQRLQNLEISYNCAKSVTLICLSRCGVFTLEERDSLCLVDEYKATSGSIISRLP